MELVQSSHFGGIQCDFYRREADSYCMTSEQLGMALGYSEPRKAVGKIVERNHYLQNEEFSGIVKMTTPGGIQETRIFTEDGIYEITMLAKTARARQFRAFVRDVLKKLRSGNLIDSRIVLELVQTQKELLDKFNLIASRIVAAPAATTDLPRLDYSKLSRSEPDHREIRLHAYKVEKLGCGEMARIMRAKGATYTEIAQAFKLKTGQTVTKSMLSRYFLALKALS